MHNVLSGGLMRDENNTPLETLKSKDVQRILNVSKSTLDTWCSQGKITYYRPSGGNRVFLVNDVINVLNKGRFVSKADRLSTQDGKAL